MDRREFIHVTCVRTYRVVVLAGVSDYRLQVALHELLLCFLHVIRLFARGEAFVRKLRETVHTMEQASHAFVLAYLCIGGRDSQVGEIFLQSRNLLHRLQNRQQL